MNKTNLELKHYCSNFSKIRQVLKDFQASKEVVKSQKDYFFNLPVGKNSPRLKMRIEGKKKMLCYYERPDFVKGKETTAKVRLYDVADNQLLKFLSESLSVKAVVEKRREVWRKENTVFHIDRVKGVGGIFEIELQKRGKITKTDRVLFRKYQDAFLPHLGKVIKGSNVDLVKQF